MSAQEEIRSDLTPIRRGSPLPWLLLGVTIATGMVMFAMGNARINDEKLRSANALKASDEVMTRLRSVVAENQRLTDDAKDLERQKAEVDDRLKRLNEQLTTSADEIAKFKSNPRCFKKER